MVGFWGLLGSLMTARAMTWWGAETTAWREIVGTFSEVGLWALLTPGVFWLVRRYPAERGAWLGRLIGQVALGVLVGVLVEYLTRGVLRPLLDGPVPAERAWSLSGAFRQLRLLDEVIIYLAVLAAGYARSALFQLQDRQLEAERLLAERARLETQLTDARLSALRMQLNPHFLFNTLNAVSALAERDPAGVRTIVARLSSLLRRVLDSDGAQTVPLREEASFLRDYLDVQRVRFRDRLRVEEAWEAGTLGALVPSLVLQPLVENAVAHGVSRIEEGEGVIRLGARREGRQLVVTVADNGPGFERAARDGGVGLPNTRARLDALYGDAGSVELAPADGGGTVATLRLPFHEPAPELAGTGPAGTGPENTGWAATESASTEPAGVERASAERPAVHA